MIANCSIDDCMHLPGFVIRCGYDLPIALKSVGAGWKGLIERAFVEKPLNVNITQVKEKYGALVIYASDSIERSYSRRSDDQTTPSLEAFINVLTQISDDSRTICEFCGEPGEITGAGGGWLKAACPRHAALRSEAGSWDAASEDVAPQATAAAS